MTGRIAKWSRKATGVLAGAVLALGAVQVSGQVQQVDPNKAIDGDLVPLSQQKAAPDPAPAPSPSFDIGTPAATDPTVKPAFESGDQAAAAAASARPAPPESGTYHEDDVMGAAEGVFGKGAHGLADVIKGILAKQGEPNGYIVGREGGGAIVFGLRYGSGTLYHKIEGQKPVYWTGPSVGFDAGANAGNTFVLVYNLFDTEDIYHRYGAGEGQAYFVGGFHVSYLRRGDVVLVPVRMGVGLRLGVNAGYMKISKKSRWFPF